jgi:VIT1/CCC1 family predicted Fe2+/Mn2+ transporter
MSNNNNDNNNNSSNEQTPLKNNKTNADDQIHHDSPCPKKEEHLGASRQYWRDIILGVNDGIISTFLLVAGVAGGGMTSSQILLTAIAGALAGAVSMMAGEYVATKSQNEVLSGELVLESIHVQEFLDEELEELVDLLEMIGIEHDEMRQPLLAYYRQNPKSLLKVMKTLEFGVVEQEVRNPLIAGVASCFLFLAGSVPSVVPFVICTTDPMQGLLLAGLATIIALFLVGAIKTWATRGHWIASAAENLIIAGCGGLLAYAVGAEFGTIMN